MQTIDIRAPLSGTIVVADAKPGDRVRAGQTLLVIESMKMEHEVRASGDGQVVRVHVRPGDLVAEADPLVSLGALEPAAEPAAAPAFPQPPAEAMPTQGARRDLQQVRERHARTLDAARPEAITRRHARGARSARENVADLCDAGSFIEYGALAVAAQSRRRTLDDLVANTPADGMITGIGSVNGDRFAADRARCVVLAYDATVLAGTQGARNHQKTDRLLGIALAQRLPVVLFAEGGGGRPGDVDVPVVAGLHVPTFASFARLSGQVPVIAVVAGRCFAGNAALAGCSDVIVATRDSNLGMGGPAMIEGGGLGVYRPEQVGPADVQAKNGVIDVLVENESQAVAATKAILSYAQGVLPAGECLDQATLRDAVPENRVRSYDVRAVMHALADRGSVLELRPAFGAGILTAFARFGGRPVAMLANNPAVLGGAIDADAADKAARFMQLADSYALPIVSLIDTPGFMVGPDIETRAQVRHASRMFVTGAAVHVPWFAVVLRKGYGLGAMAMAGGGMHAPVATIAWPTGEFGAMGLEGAVQLGYRKELEAAPAGPEREALYRRLVDQQYEKGKALNMAATLEIDAVIDPAETRDWLLRALAGTAALRGAAQAVPRRFIDPW